MNKIRFDFLDGIRGLSALWVVLFHSLLFNGMSDPQIKWSDNNLLFAIEKYLSLGHLAVAIFIILSGFCLAIPVMNNNMEFKGGLKRYITRRAKRLIPPYYIALALSILMILFIPILQVPMNTTWDSKIPLTYDNILAHVLLIHNLNDLWVFKINGAHWSVATEWHIYFLFPLMLLFWKRTNLYISFAIFAIFAYILTKIIPFAAPEFLILFFMGVICCYLSFKSTSTNKLLFSLSIIIFVFGLTIMLFRPLPHFYGNILNGATFSFLLYNLTSYKRVKRMKFPLLENKSSMFLGKISYSLYLIHGPILALLNLLLLKNYKLSDDTRQLILFIFVFVLILPLSTLFYHTVEKRFLNK